MKRLLILPTLLLLLLTTTAWGQGTLYVVSDQAPLRVAPNDSAVVVINLQRGHQLMSFGTQNGWVEVGAAGTGEMGWLPVRSTSPTKPSKVIQAIETEAFKDFKAALSILNARSERAAGFVFFTSAQYLGDGIVEITASKRWLAFPFADRAGNLKTLFNLWDAAEGTGLPIAVYIVDQSGKRRMSRTR